MVRKELLLLLASLAAGADLFAAQSRGIEIKVTPRPYCMNQGPSAKAIALEGQVASHRLRVQIAGALLGSELDKASIIEDDFKRGYFFACVEISKDNDDKTLPTLLRRFSQVPIHRDLKLEVSAAPECR